MINAAVYCKMLPLRRAIQNKGRGMLTSGIVLIHDDAHPHSAGATQPFLVQCQWNIFNHPPYSPDLVPIDFHLFPDLEKWLGGQSFQTNGELQTNVKTYLNSLAATFYGKGIVKLVHRCDKQII
ncbi:histone-lysine N-methyltransferase SETMAR-like [Hetaerina americana]|uniref:histone-lysine N-methyltransferase SETMAR-like n=1 Tax=Hetaerina americana TaxID=62018 RepID=UPI003A7F1BAF